MPQTVFAVIMKLSPSGHSKVEVLARCDELASKEVTGTGRIKVEKWVYARGAGDFVYVLIFHGGELKYVEQSGRAR